MGCNSSTLDRLPAVALCRDRCKFLDEALRQSYSLADAHLAHMHSLKTLAPALHSFFHLLHHQDPAGHAIQSPPFAASPDHASSSSSDSDLHLHSHSKSSETENNTDKDFQFLKPTTRYDYLNRDDDPAPDDLSFMNYMQPLYPPFPPPLPNSKPPSPPPLGSSAWDFLNLFETFEKYEVPYSPSRDIKERESQRSNEFEQGSKNKAEPKKVKADSTEKEQREAKDRGEPAAKVESAKGVSEMMKEIQILLERASDSGIPVLEMLDVGKLRYHRGLDVNPVSCKMMHMFSTPLVFSKPQTTMSQRTGTGPYYQRVDKDGGNLSCTLKKLSMWEKKLYDEVKVEEKLHVLYKKKCRQLNRMMSKKRVDAQKVAPLEAFIQIISTKMKISIQVVDKTSNTICKLGEEELWPLINEFILRLLEMWKEMQECCRSQKQGIEEARISVEACRSEQISKEHVEAAIRLKSELQKWNMSFSEWIYSQKCHIKALNGWLLRCLTEEGTGEEGSATPSSVLVICNKWWQAVDKISDKNVTEAVNEFILGVNEVLDKYISSSELQQRLAVDKELERRVREVERHEQKMQKVVAAREKMKTEGGVHHAQVFESGGGSLGCRLKRIFSAMESLAAISASAYELLCQHIQQDYGRHCLLGRRPHTIH